MKPYELCQWVSNEEVSFLIRISPLMSEEQCTCSSMSSQVLEMTRAEYRDVIHYQPDCSVMQTLEKCSYRLDISPCESYPRDTAINDCCVPLPFATTRIAADGNCFFRSVSLHTFHASSESGAV